MVSEHYSSDCFFARNRYMVDKADVVVCAYDGQSGGTAYTVNYALKKGKIVIQINPSTAEVTIISKEVFESCVVFEVIKFSRNPADKEFRFIAVGSGHPNMREQKSHHIPPIVMPSDMRRSSNSSWLSMK